MMRVTLHYARNDNKNKQTALGFDFLVLLCQDKRTKPQPSLRVGTTRQSIINDEF